MLPLTSKVLVAHALLQLTLRNGAERAVQRLAVQLTCLASHSLTIKAYTSLHMYLSMPLAYCGNL